MPTRKKDQTFQFHFKLFNNLKDESEAELGRRELQALFGDVEAIENFVDEFVAGILTPATLDSDSKDPLRLQDAITYELPYGRIKGFKGRGPIDILPKLVRRLAYTREIYVTLPEGLSEPKIENLTSGLNLFVYFHGRTKTLRTITNQYFLEKSAYISKLSRNKKEIDVNLETLFAFQRTQSHRIPATETMAVGRRLEDWFAIREEPSLYLTHYMHPYKGKFHPKMARALINYTFPGDTGRVLDNFSGSGTTLVEANWLGLDSFGVDINPLSSLMSQVKAQCLEIKSDELAIAVEKFLEILSAQVVAIRAIESGQQTLSASHKVDLDEFSNIISKLPKRVIRDIPKSQIQQILVARRLLDTQFGKLNGSKQHEFLLLGVSGAISDISRRTSQEFLEVLVGRLWNLWGRVYLCERLAQSLRVGLGKGVCAVGDTRDLSGLKTLGGKSVPLADNSVDCIVNSPPYSTALDYIRNDLPQLSILQFVDNMDALERNLVGNPNLKVYGEELQSAILTNREPFRSLPDAGRLMLKRMVDSSRGQDAGRVLKFWEDMKQTLVEMERVLKPAAKAAVVIGDNNVQLEKGSKKFEQVPNVLMLQELGQEVGLTVVETIQREIEKSMTGMIRNEAIIIFQKRLKNRRGFE